jgi:hypothetical protein
MSATKTASTQGRDRGTTILTLAAVIVLGLASRAFPAILAALGKYPGDALWALMVLLGIVLIKPNIPPTSAALLALIFSFGVEFSQLYHAPWIDAIRRTRIGHLALGFTFAWQDLVAYTAGVLLGWIADVTIGNRR